MSRRCNHNQTYTKSGSVRQGSISVARPENEEGDKADQWGETDHEEAEFVAFVGFNLFPEIDLRGGGDDPASGGEEARERSHMFVGKLLGKSIVVGMETEDPRAGDEEQGDHEPAVAGVGDERTAGGEEREDEVAEEARGVDLPACGGEAFDEHSRKDAADIGGDEVARHESAGEFFGVFVVVLKEECEPGAEELPTDGERGHHHGENDESPEEVIEIGGDLSFRFFGILFFQGEFRESVGFGGGEVATGDECEPGGDPEESDDADGPEGEFPGLPGPFPEFDIEGDDDCSDGGSALEDAVAERAVFFVEDGADGQESAGPVSRFKDSERDATDEQPVIDPRAGGITGFFEQRGEPGLTGEGRGNPRERPPAEDNRIEESGTGLVGDDAEEDGPEGEGVSETAFDHPDPSLREIELRLESGECDRQGLAVHVIEESREEEDAANGPRPPAGD